MVPRLQPVATVDLSVEFVTQPEPTETSRGDHLCRSSLSGSCTAAPQKEGLKWRRSKTGDCSNSVIKCKSSPNWNSKLRKIYLLEKADKIY